MVPNAFPRLVACGAVIVCASATVVLAGLRPFYGGDLVLIAPAAPQTTAPLQAWSPVEIALANATGARLSTVVEGPPVLNATGTTLRLTVRADAAWADNTAISAKALAKHLQSAIEESPVSLIPLNIRIDGRDVVVDLPAALSDAWRYIDLPWLRLARASDGGGFRMKHNMLDADPVGIGGRSLVDHVRLEAKEGRHTDPAPNAIALAQPGADGRPVFAAPRPGGTSAQALTTVLAAMDRAAMARLFVRNAALVPDGWTPKVTDPAASSSAPVVIAVDAAERDLRTIAERLQVLLRDRHISARIASEDRPAYFTRLTKGDYDLALIAIPTAPPLVQAATLLKWISGPAAADRLWAASVSASKNDKLLHDTADSLGAVLLYVEGGGLTHGARVRDLVAPMPWDLELANVWLAPAGTTP